MGDIEVLGDAGLGFLEAMLAAGARARIPVTTNARCVDFAWADRLGQDPGECAKERRVIAKIEWHTGELFPRVGFIVTNLPMEPDWVMGFYNQRGTAEQHIKEGKYAFHWTRLSCKRFRDNEVRLQLHVLAYNLATFLRRIELPEAMADWSLTSLQLKLIKIGARVVRHARAITFQLAEVAVTGAMVRAILAAIRRLRAPPSCA
jgi:hypothetical protein